MIWEYSGLKALVCTSVHEYTCNFMAIDPIVDNVNTVYYYKIYLGETETLSIIPHKNGMLLTYLPSNPKTRILDVKVAHMEALRRQEYSGQEYSIQEYHKSRTASKKCLNCCYHGMCFDDVVKAVYLKIAICAALQCDDASEISAMQLIQATGGCDVAIH
jgi:hypothetical protein